MELASVGYFIKTHGVKGQIILKIEHQFKEKDVKVLFIETATGKAPFFINGFKNNNHGLIFSLEEITSVEQAKKLIGKVVFIAKNILLEKEEEFNWLDYILIDKLLDKNEDIRNILSIFSLS
jgi:ribosomal 30S subunit maturation factor RimM